MKFLATIAVALGAFAVADAYDCGAGGSNDVVIGNKCVCNSGFAQTAADTCTAFATNGCPSETLPVPTATAANTVAEVTLADNAAATSDTKIAFTLKIPMTSARKFKNIYVTTTGDNTTPGASCTDGTAFDDFASVAGTTSGGSCADQWTLGVKFSKLLECGFVYDATGAKYGTPSTGYQRFGGTVRVVYEDTVTMGADAYAQQVTRTSTIDYPVVVDLQSTYEVAMTVNDVRVFATQSIDFAIKTQTISKDVSVEPSIELTYGIQYPYRISAFGAVSTTDAITATATLGTQCTYDSTPANSDYTGATNTCTKSGNYINFNTNGRNNAAECKFTGYTYTLAFTVDCGNGVPAADCPFLAADSTDNSAVFTITSENFCVSQAVTNTIDNVITITDFKAVAVADFQTAKEAWRYGDAIFMRMQFAGILMNSVALTKLERYYSTTAPTGGESYTTVSGPTPGGISLTGYVATGSASDALTGMQNPLPTDMTGLNGIDLGLQTEGTTSKYQVFRFRLLVNDALLGDTPARGERKYMKLKATVDVTYNRAGNAGELRRRRQAANEVSGQGASESSTQSIEPVEAAAVAPNSGVRAAPAVALVLAILSAVALL